MLDSATYIFPYDGFHISPSAHTIVVVVKDHATDPLSGLRFYLLLILMQGEG